MRSLTEAGAAVEVAAVEVAVQVVEVQVVEVQEVVAAVLVATPRLTRVREAAHPAPAARYLD